MDASVARAVGGKPNHSEDTEPEKKKNLIPIHQKSHQTDTFTTDHLSITLTDKE